MTSRGRMVPDVAILVPPMTEYENQDSHNVEEARVPGVRQDDSPSGFAQRLARLLGGAPEPAMDLEGEGPANQIPEEVVDVAPRNTRYRMRREVGRGGMGAVLEVWDGDLRRRLAMKVLLKQGGADGSRVDERTLSRFLEEAQVTGQLEHPGILPVHELGIGDEGRVYFTMRLVRGRELKEIFQLVHSGEGEAEGWTQERALGSLLRVCEAMAYAHSKGVIHRDLKPSNIMIGRFGETYVMDWGLARVLGREDTRDLRPRVSKDTSLSIVRTDRREESDSGSSSHLLTMDGDVVGTPSYMAPEQAKGQLEKIGAHSDVYSVGAMLYHLLTASVPFVPEGANLSAHRILMCVMEGPPKPVGALASDAPPELLAICERAMAREIEDRYADMGAFAEDMRAFLEGRVVRAYQTGALAEFRKWIERNRLTAAAAAVAVIAVVGGLAWGWVAQTERNATLHTARQAAEEAADNALRQSYAANMAAAQAALARHDTVSARRYLAGCSEAMRGWEWYHIQGQTDESLTSLRLAGDATAIAPGGRWVATWGEDKGVSLMSVTGEIVHRWVWPDQSPRRLAVSGDGQLVATASHSMQLAVWESGRKIWEKLSYMGGFDSLAFTQDGSRLVVQDQYRVILLESRSGKELGQFGVLTRPRLGLNHDGSKIVAGREGLALIWDTESLEVVHQLGTSGRIASSVMGPVSAAALGIRTPMALSPDGKQLATAYGTGGVWIWDLETLTPAMTFRGHESVIDCMAFSPDGSTLATGGRDQTLRIWDLESRGEGPVLRGHSASVKEVVYLGEGDELVSLDVAGQLRTWHLGVEGERRDIPLSGTRIWKIAFHPDGRHLAIIDGYRPIVSMVDLLLGQTTRSYIGREGVTTNLGFSPDGMTLATGVSIDLPDGTKLRGKSAFLWDTGKFVWRDHIPTGTLLRDGNPWSADGRFLVTVDAQEEGGEPRYGSEAGKTLLVLRTVATERVLRELGNGVRREGGEPTEKSEAGKTRLVLRNAATGRVLRELGNGLRSWVFAEFSPDSQLLLCSEAIITAPGQISRRHTLVLDVTTGEELFRSESLPGEGQAAWTHDGDSFLVLDENGLRRLSAKDGTPEVAFEPAPFRPVAFALHPGGGRLAACGDYSAITIWETERGRIIASLPLPSGNGRDIAFSPDGSSLLVATLKALHIWGQGEPGVEYRRRREAEEAWDASETVVEDLFDELGTPDHVLKALEDGSVGLEGAPLAAARRRALARTSDFDGREPVLLARLRDPTRSPSERQHDLEWARLALEQSPDGKHRLRVVAAARLRTGDAEGALTDYRSYYAARERLTFTALGLWENQVVSVTNNGPLRLRAERDGVLGEIIEERAGGIRDVAVLDDGSLISAGANHTVKRWNPVTRESELLFTWKGSRSHRLDLSTEGHRLVTGGFGGEATVYDVEKGEIVATLGGKESKITGLAISGNGLRVATAQSSNILRVWDVAEGVLILETDLVGGNILKLALNREGTRLALLRRRQQGVLLLKGIDAVLWDVNAGTSLPLDLPEAWTFAKSTIGTLCYDRTGDSLAVGGSGLALFDGATGDRRSALDLDGASVQILAFDLVGNQLLAGCSDRQVRLIDLRENKVRFASPEPLNLSVAGIDDLAFYLLALMETGRHQEAAEVLADLKDRAGRQKIFLRRLENAAALVEEALDQARDQGMESGGGSPR